MGKNKQFLAGQFQANNDELKSKLNKTIDLMVTITEGRNLPTDIPIPKSLKDKDIDDALQLFYEQLGMPFFNSLTKEQITKLSPSQKELFRLHVRFKRLLVLKSQKIGISSICILIVLWHALTDCVGMELIINAQSDEQAKTHAQDLRRILQGSDLYRDYLITSEFTALGLLKDEVTKVHTIYLHNPHNPRLPTKIIVVGMSPSALLSHKRVGFIWSSDMTISNQTAARQNLVWAAMLSRLANSEGPLIVECPARAPEGPVYDTWDAFEKALKDGIEINSAHDFFVVKFKYERGIREGFFTQEFIDAEKRRLGPYFGTFYEADFFASESTWYKEEHFNNVTKSATDLFFEFQNADDRDSDITDD